jgi:hypothetical protein
MSERQGMAIKPHPPCVLKFHGNLTLKDKKEKLKSFTP